MALFCKGGIFCNLDGGDLPNNKKEAKFSAAVRGEGNRRVKVVFEG